MEFKNFDEKFLYENIKNKRKYLKLKKELETKPLSYILGNTNFYGYEYKVNKNTLIPRFETEELVENTLNYIKEYFDYPIEALDIGTGSGAIGITLVLENPNIEVTMTDISKKALSIAKKNTKKHKIKANFIKSDFLENITKKYDLIISNPPYIDNKEDIDQKVLNNEPHLALFGGIEVYDKILKGAKPKLKQKSIIAFEFGYNQKKDLKEVIKKYFPKSKVIFKKDLSKKDRMVFIFNE